MAAKCPPAGMSVHPRTGKPQAPKFLGGDEPILATGADRRVAYATLTSEGRARIEAAVAVHIGHLDEVFTGLLSASQQAALEDALRVVRDNLNPGATCGV